MRNICYYEHLRKIGWFHWYLRNK